MSNLYILAADNSPALLPLLRSNPALASGQDEHGYSLVHAAASYNHLDLLRTLVGEFSVNVNLCDEDDETALFFVENLQAARVLVEELGANVGAKNGDGITASQKIAEDNEFPEVAEYLRSKEVGGLLNGAAVDGDAAVNGTHLPPAPGGLTVAMSTMTPEEADEAELDPEFRRRIEQLAERNDFHTGAGQAELRQLVQDAIEGRNLAERHVRPRRD